MRKLTPCVVLCEITSKVFIGVILIQLKSNCNIFAENNVSNERSDRYVKTANGIMKIFLHNLYICIENVDIILMTAFRSSNKILTGIVETTCIKMQRKNVVNDYFYHAFDILLITNSCKSKKVQIIFINQQANKNVLK